MSESVARAALQLSVTRPDINFLSRPYDQTPWHHGHPIPVPHVVASISWVTLGLWGVAGTNQGFHSNPPQVHTAFSILNRNPSDSLDVFHQVSIFPGAFVSSGVWMSNIWIAISGGERFRGEHFSQNELWHFRLQMAKRLDSEQHQVLEAPRCWKVFLCHLNLWWKCRKMIAFTCFYNFQIFT